MPVCNVYLMLNPLKVLQDFRLTLSWLIDCPLWNETLVPVWEFWATLIFAFLSKSTFLFSTCTWQLDALSTQRNRSIRQLFCFFGLVCEPTQEYRFSSVVLGTVKVLWCGCFYELWVYGYATTWARSLQFCFRNCQWFCTTLITSGTNCSVCFDIGLMSPPLLPQTLSGF